MDAQFVKELYAVARDVRTRADEVDDIIVRGALKNAADRLDDVLARANCVALKNVAAHTRATHAPVPYETSHGRVDGDLTPPPKKTKQRVITWVSDDEA